VKLFITAHVFILLYDVGPLLFYRVLRCSEFDRVKKPTFRSYFLCSEEKIIIGLGKDGPALEINSDLSIGFSYKSEILSS